MRSIVPIPTWGQSRTSLDVWHWLCAWWRQAERRAQVLSIKAAVKRVAATFATRIGLWDRTRCYELTEMVPPGEFKKHVRAIEHGCIWMDMNTKEKVVFHIEPAAGKYYRALSDMMGLQWHTMDYLSLGNGIFLCARAFMNYDVGQSTDGKKYFRHDVTSDLGVDGILFYVLMINEIVIVLIMGVFMKTSAELRWYVRQNVSISPAKTPQLYGVCVL